MIGDSKTYEIGNSWPATLKAALNLATAGSKTWRYDNVGVAASTAGYWATNIAAVLAGQKENHTNVLYNVGVNDFGGATETQWKADVLAVLDAIVARWPAAQVWLMRPWKRNFDATADTYAGWIDTVVAARSFAHAGPDERVWLKGADDGAANTTDGVHYSTAGEAACAAAWQTAMGH